MRLVNIQTHKFGVKYRCSISDFTMFSFWNSKHKENPLGIINLSGTTWMDHQALLIENENSKDWRIHTLGFKPGRNRFISWGKDFHTIRWEMRINKQQTQIQDGSLFNSVSQCWSVKQKQLFQNQSLIAELWNFSLSATDIQVCAMYFKLLEFERAECIPDDILLQLTLTCVFHFELNKKKSICILLSV